MWSYVDSDGRRVDGIQYEQDARWIVLRRGMTERIGLYSWHVTEASGYSYTAEIRHS